MLDTDVVYFHSSILEKHKLLEDGRAYHLSWFYALVLVPLIFVTIDAPESFTVFD